MTAPRKVTFTVAEVVHLVLLAQIARPDSATTSDAIMATFYKAKSARGAARIEVTP